MCMPKRELHSTSTSSASNSANPSWIVSMALARFCRAASAARFASRQPRVGLVQQVQRVFQIARALAHLILQHRGALELGIGRPAVVGDLLDPPHQHMGDLQQLFASAARADRRG